MIVSIARLVDSENDNEGRVQVRYDDEWAYVAGLGNNELQVSDFSMTNRLDSRFHQKQKIKNL